MRLDHYANSRMLHRFLICIFSLSVSVGSYAQERAKTGHTEPAISQFFKFRSNHSEFKKVRLSIAKHVHETRLLIQEFEKGLDSTSGSDNSYSTLSRLDSKLLEVRNVKNELARVGDNINHIRLGKVSQRLARIERKLEKLKFSTTKSEKRKALEAAKKELTSFNGFKQHDKIPLRQQLQPKGMTFQPAPLPIDAEVEEQPVNDQAKTEGYELKQFVISSLGSLINFLIPRANAEEYQLPSIESGVSACYESLEAYNQNIDKDLDLSQPELEVSLSLDSTSYNSITALAAELDYDPKKIFEYVSNHIEHEHYVGSVKGALGALESRGANDFDHASLLVALLRASSIPAKYALADVYIQDKPEHLDWFGVKSIDAAGKAVSQARIPRTSIEMVEGSQAFGKRHVWVEACVPYANYRGTKTDTQGFQWVSLDASYKQYERVDGLDFTVPFDYSDFLSQRTKDLPFEAYEKHLLEAARQQDPNISLGDIGTRWSQKSVDYEFLPNTLPYMVKSHVDWSAQIGDYKTAVLPEEWIGKVRISLDNNSAFDMPMADFAQHRVTLSFEGVSATEKTQYLEFLDGDRVFSCDDGAFNVRPVVKKDGIEVQGLNLSSVSICDNDQYRTLSMGMAARIEALGANAVVSVTSGGSSEIEFDSISPLDYYAITAYPFNGSEEYLQSRTERLLNSLNSVQKPSEDIDETLGEFLNVVLIKYMKYITEANLRVGEYFNTTGRSGHHIGLTSTKADVQYLFDLPYALQSNNFVVDVPGGAGHSIDINDGSFNTEGIRLSSYSMSHYESYVWQENALKDAISTISGLQIASENENEVQAFTSAQEVRDFVLECTDIPDTNSWPRSKSLSEMVQSFRAAGLYHSSDDSLRDFFIQNNGYFTSYSSTSQIDTALGAEFEYCFQQSLIDNIVSANFPSGYENKVTISQRPVEYNGWVGPVYVSESIKTDGSAISMGFPISAYSGGYTVPTPDPIFYTPPSYDYSNSSFDLFSTGFDIPESVSSTTTDFTSDTVSVVNSGIGNGTSTHETVAFDPVNMVTGNMYHEETDFSAPTKGLPLIFSRTYNSRNPEMGPLGWGWTHGFNQKLDFSDTDNSGKVDTIKWTNGTGSEKFITLDASIKREGPLGILHLEQDKVNVPDGYYFEVLRPYWPNDPENVSPFIIREKNQTLYRFSPVLGEDGDIARLISIEESHGHLISLDYDSAGNLETVSDEDGQTLSFTYYSGTNRIHTITLDWANEVHEYFYDDEGHLTAYRNPKDQSENIDSSAYQYYSDSDGHNLEHRMKTFGYANGYQMTFEYYVNGKAYRHFNALGETATFLYNDFRRESATINELGQVQRYIFNEHGLPVEITDQLGGKEFYKYEDANDPFLRTSVINSMGYETLFEYDSFGNLIKETMPSGDTVEYSHFTNFGKPGLIKNAEDNYRLITYTFEGDIYNNVTFKDGYGVNLVPDFFFDPAQHADYIKTWTTHFYDVNGKLESKRALTNFNGGFSGPFTIFDYTDTDNNTEGLVVTGVTYRGDMDGDGVIGSDEGLGSYPSKYDSRNRLIDGVDGARYPIKVKYDEAGRVTEKTTRLGGTQNITRDESGLPISQSIIAKANGKVELADQSFTKYDLVGRPIAKTDASGATTHLSYDAASNLKKITSPDGYVVHFDYDANNRLIKTYDEEGNTVERKLDLLGRVKQLIDPNGNITTYEYYGPEENGRLKRVTSAESRWSEFEYSAAGQVIKVTDNTGRETLTDYDELGRVIRVVNPSYDDTVLGTVRPVTTYQYNALGHQTHVYAGYTNAAGEKAADKASIEARYEYDDFGRLLKKYDAADNVWEITEYDVHGNALSSRDPNGNVSTFTYGVGGVLESQTTTGPAGTESISYTRNGLGQPINITSNNVSFSYEYDSAHRLTKVTDSRGGNYVEFDYSVGGLLNSITDSNSNKTSYMYDPVGRLTGIRTPDSGLISYVYDAAGRLQQKVFPNDLKTAYEYFNDNKVKSISTTNQVGTELVRQDYTYNGAGDTATALFSLQGNTQSRSYHYDGLGRLIKERDEDSASDLDVISYDPAGNRRTRIVGGQTRYYNHNNLHQIDDIRLGSAAGSVFASFAYDDNGNMTTKTYNGITTTLAYDSLDRVVGISKDGLPTEIYAYDHGTRRVQSTIGSTAINYHYSGPDIIGEYGNDWSSPLATFAHGAAMDDPLVRIAANDSQYYHGDGLGSVVAMSDRLGSLSATNRYDAWGNLTAETGTTPQYGFTGREESDTGLIYFRARFYDPEIGRFTQLDPKGFIDGINRYAYVMNSPVNYIDPWGTSANSPTISGNSGGYFDRVATAGRGVATGLFGASTALIGATPDPDLFYDFGSTLYDAPVAAGDFQAGHNFGYMLGTAGLISTPAARQPTSSPKPVVTAQAEVGNAVFVDVNQTARTAANAQQPTLIADRVASKTQQQNKAFPNGNMATAHAEIGAMQQAYNSGVTSGADMTLKVTGQSVCGFCRGDVAAMAEKSGLNSLTVIEEATGKTMNWVPGNRSIK